MPKIIAETADVLVVNKPAGLIVHSDGRTKEPTLSDWILKEYPALEHVGEPWVSPQGETIILPGIVHRLDRSTSGVMLIAKTPEAYAYLKNEFKERRVEKTYLAYVHGRMEEQGRIVAEIMRAEIFLAGTPALENPSGVAKRAPSAKRPKHWYARPTDESDKRAAITDWKLLKNLAETAYIEVRPRTGRTHQIRVHLSSINHPVVGDPLYSGDRASSEEVLSPAGRMYLHASTISLTLPDGQTPTFQAPLPPDFLSVSPN